MHRARSYIYHETFRVFRHDTGYGVCTEQIPCLGVGPTPEHAIADLVHRVHRTKLPLVLAYAAMPDEAPIPTDIDYLDGRLSVQVSVQNGTYRYQVHLLDLVASAEGAPDSPLPWSALAHTLFPGSLANAFQKLQNASRREEGH